MSYYIQMQKAIDYIEEHLNEKIHLTELSKVTGYSIPQIYKIFGAMVGYSVMAYTRKRRLSNALYELISSDQSIIDIALNHGYDSHEAFSRTFKQVYGAPPSHFRSSGRPLVLFEPINLLSNKKLKGEHLMKPEIIYKETITLVGIKNFVTGPAKDKFQKFKESKTELMKNIHLIKNRKDNLFIAAYDMELEDIYKEHDDMNYTYYYCVETLDDKNVPEHMVTKKLPPSKYAIFRYDKTNKTLNRQKIDRGIYDYINGVWLPESGYELNNLNDYEVFDLDNNRVDYYISIK